MRNPLKHKTLIMEIKSRLDELDATLDSYDPLDDWGDDTIIDVFGYIKGDLNQLSTELERHVF